ncbi:MAG TPA: hypothetical protein VNU66_12630 [Mycobacteriales bacterium]|nr:hypothetical protein [Mycobacteriales bacterium]
MTSAPALDRQRQRAVRAGRLTRVAPGLVLADPAGRELLRAAVDHGGPGARATGALLLHLRGWRWAPEVARAQVLVPAERRRVSTPLVPVRRCRGLDALADERWAGLPVAPPARALLDAGLHLPHLGAVRGVVLAAVADGRVRPQDVTALLAREPRGGTARVRRALLDAARGAASPPEAELADALAGCGVPFCLNPDLLVDGVLVGRPDVWLLGRGTGAEVDSLEHHGSQDDLDATLDRDLRFTERGLVLAHVTPRRLRAEPRRTVARLLETARGRQDPPGLTVRLRGPVLR